KYSDDPSKEQNHGLMPDARSKQYVPAFSAAAQSLKIPGEISQLVHTKYGYHILKLVSRTSDTQLKYDEVKDQLVDDLRNEYINRSVKTHSDELRNQPVDANPDIVVSLRDRYGTVATPDLPAPAMPGEDAQAPAR
ncbi:MAG TPA: peptidylprolyl isomerase, partial [Rhodanobacteraceae bacterium]|nr:peptidylprolyl isomerase [Rhodanobacteraceae bacterium]